MNNTQTTRTCKKCSTVKPITEFPLYSKATEGRRHECIACNKIRVNEHHAANKEHRAKQARKRYAKDPSKYWSPERRKKANESSKRRNAELRDIVYAQYGDKCECCGESNKLFLTIDHVNNDGKEKRKIHGTGTALYRWIIKNNYPSDFQLFCMNCNFAKARNGGICPHQESSETIRKE